MNEQRIDRACPDCLGPGYRIGVDAHGREVVEVEHDAGCPHLVIEGESA